MSRYRKKLNLSTVLTPRASKCDSPFDHQRRRAIIDLRRRRSFPISRAALHAGADDRVSQPVKLTARNLKSQALARLETILGILEEEFRSRIKSASEITSLPDHKRAAFLIQFANSSRIKLSVPWACDYYPERTSRIGSLYLPRLLIKNVEWAAFEWIEGRKVADLGLSRQIVNRAARGLRDIHTAQIEFTTAIANSILDDARVKLKTNLRVLVANRIVSDAQAQFITQMGRSRAASRFNVSLIHGDFAPDNLVLCGKKLYSVDNDKLRLFVTEYDLCRAITFWDEWNLSGRTLAHSYARLAGVEYDPEVLHFWAIFDLVYRISYRFSAFGERNKFCIARLKRILKTGNFQ